MSPKKRNILKSGYILIAAIVLAGCIMRPYGGTFNFEGPTQASEQMFAQQLYSCAQQSQSTASSGYINQYGGGYASNSYPSCSMMMACMAANGYTQNPDGRFNSQPFAVRCQP